MPSSWHLSHRARRIERNLQREEDGGQEGGDRRTGTGGRELVYERKETNDKAAACLICGTSGGEFNGSYCTKIETQNRRLVPPHA